MTIFCSLLYFIAIAQKSTVLTQKGNEAYKKGAFENAQALYKQALEANKTDSAALFNNGNALMHMNNFTAAAEQYENLIENNTNKDLQAKAFYNKGLSAIKQNQLPEAIQAFKQSLRINPSDEDARENLQKAINELKKQNNNPKNSSSKNNQNKEQPKPQDSKNKLTKQQAENLLQQLRQEEKYLQEKQKQKIKQTNPDKDW